MSNINNQTKDLFALDTVRDLDHESAAAIQGGIQLYADANFQGALLPTNAIGDLSQVPGNLNDQTSSIINDTDKVWQFCTDANFGGQCTTLDPGFSFPDLNGTVYQDSISSYKSL